jgi:hypothetical protein
MKHGMHLGDYLDLEWFLEQDKAAAPGQILERDRKLGLAALAESVSPELYGQFWLAQRREQDAGTLPSGILATLMTVLGWVLACSGLLAGISLVRGLLLYSGAEPVNVSVFLLLAVFPQAGLCLLAAGMLVARALGRGELRIPLRRLLDLLWRRPGLLSPQAGFVRALFLSRGWPARMLAWDSLRRLHLGGLCLAAGSLAGMIVSVAVTDLAFGWQSTLQVGAQGMHGLVSTLALPWSWLPTHWGLAPSLSQIEGSRIILKDGISTLANADLIAWWPFLSMCIFSYALLPRLLLVVLSHRALRRVERDFVHPDLGRIVDRMRAPRLGSATAGERASTPLPLGGSLDRKDVEGAVASAAGGEVGCVLLLPPELQGRIGNEALGELALRVCGYPLSRVFPVALDAEEIRQLLAECAGFAWTGGHERFVVLVEGWQPPIRENLQALNFLGLEGGGSRSLTLVLAGRPAGGNWLTAPSGAEQEMWTEAVARLAPLRVDIFGASS